MKSVSLSFIFLLFLLSCHSSSSGQESSGQSNKNHSVSALSEEDSTTPSWEILFNGRNLNGWQGFQHRSTAAWDVVDGTLHCDGNKKTAPTDLITDSSYKNFILSVKWKISPGSNSGIMFHVTEDQPQTSLTGPEYQIIDDKGWPGKLEDWQLTGCNYAMQVPDSTEIHPVGEWNTSKIIVSGAHVEHWLNGQKILQYTLWSPEWKVQKAAGKWKDVPSYGMSKSGHIALQYHGGDVWFKGIKIKNL